MAATVNFRNQIIYFFFGIISTPFHEMHNMKGWSCQSSRMLFLKHTEGLIMKSDAESYDESFRDNPNYDLSLLLCKPNRTS
jgi:hypothetical protein